MRQIVGCFKIGENFDRAVLLYEDDCEKNRFVAYDLLSEPRAISPPQLVDLPMVALDQRKSFCISKKAARKEIYVVDAKAFTSRTLTFYPGMTDVFAIRKFYKPKAQVPRDLPEGMLKALFPVSHFLQGLLYQEKFEGPTMKSANSQANQDRMHEWFVFRTGVAKELDAREQNKEGKKGFSLVRHNLSPFLLAMLQSSIPDDYSHRNTTMTKKLSVLSTGRTVRHDNVNQFCTEIKVTDLSALYGLFGTFFSTTPIAARMSSMTSTLPANARMLTFSSFRFIFDVVNRTVEVMVIKQKYILSLIYLLNKYIYQMKLAGASQLTSFNQLPIRGAKKAVQEGEVARLKPLLEGKILYDEEEEAYRLVVCVSTDSDGLYDRASGAYQNAYNGPVVFLTDPGVTSVDEETLTGWTFE